MAASVISILKCPVSNEPLSLTRLSELSGVSTDKIADELSLLESALNTTWDQKGLVTPDKQYFYPIIDNIFILLPELCLTAAKKGETHQAAWDRERVQSFYNKFGWTRKEGGGAYEDTKMFVDQRDVARDYQIRAEERIASHLSSGTYLLDIASGALHNTRYHSFSQNYKYRICIDFSIAALIEARKNIGYEHGIFILGDITSIPLMDNCCDGVISLHTLYHVHKERQETAVCELVRVCKPEAKVVIAYNWGWHSLLMNLTLLPVRALKMVRKLLNDRAQKLPHKDKSRPSLYFYPHSMSWFKNIKHRDWDMEIYCQKSLHTDFIRLYAHEQLGGERLLRLVSELENKHPGFFGRYGSFPLIIIKKRNPLGIGTGSR